MNKPESVDSTPSAGVGSGVLLGGRADEDKLNRLMACGKIIIIEPDRPPLSEIIHVLKYEKSPPIPHIPKQPKEHWRRGNPKRKA